MMHYHTGISAYHPHSHTFQGLKGTRQMDGYTGHIMSLVMDNNRKLSPIDILLTDLSDKMFILGEFIPKKYEKNLSKYSARFRFLSKYLQKYYIDDFNLIGKAISLPNSASVFASIIEARTQPLDMLEVLSNKKFGLTKKDVYGKPTIVDKLLQLYSDTEEQIINTHNDLLGQCPYRSSDENLYMVNNPAKRFWRFVEAYQATSSENMGYLIHKKIINKDIDPLLIFFRKMIKYCVRREKSILPAVKSLMKESKNNSIENQERKRKVRLNWNIEQARISIKDSIKGKHYSDQMNQVFTEMMEELTRHL